MKLFMKYNKITDQKVENSIYFLEWERLKIVFGYAVHNYFIIFILWLGWVYNYAILSETVSYAGFLKHVDDSILNISKSELSNSIILSIE